MVRGGVSSLGARNPSRLRFRRTAWQLVKNSTDAGPNRACRVLAAVYAGPQRLRVDGKTPRLRDNWRVRHRLGQPPWVPPTPLWLRCTARWRSAGSGPRTCAPSSLLAPEPCQPRSAEDALIRDLPVAPTHSLEASKITPRHGRGRVHLVTKAPPTTAFEPVAHHRCGRWPPIWMPGCDG